MIESEALKKKLDTSVFDVIKELIDVMTDHGLALRNLDNRVESVEGTIVRKEVEVMDIERLEYLEAKVKELKAYINVHKMQMCSTSSKYDEICGLIADL